MAKETKSTIVIATISAISAVLVAGITTFGTIYVSDSEAQKVKERLEGLSDLKIVNLPVGTIVPSMLEPSLFAEAVGDPPVFNPEISKWVLADAQKDIRISGYGKLLVKTNTPDLCRVFLRGMYDGREVGSYQADAFVRHSHRLPVSENPGEVWGFRYGGQGGYEGTHYRVTDVTGQDETRPKNVAVYFYIKIN